MFELLAQVNWEDVGVMIGSVILVLTSGKGITWMATRKTRANGKYVSEKVCALRHRQEDERHQAVLTAIGKVEDGITRLHERIDRRG